MTWILNPFTQSHTCGAMPNRPSPNDLGHAYKGYRPVGRPLEAHRDIAQQIAPQAPPGLLQQLEHVLWQLVGLGHHGGARLLQDLSAAQVGGFLGKVGIHDAAARCGEIFAVDL